jgi:hypothetical protein
VPRFPMGEVLRQPPVAGAAFAKTSMDVTVTDLLTLGTSSAIIHTMELTFEVSATSWKVHQEAALHLCLGQARTKFAYGRHWSCQE